MHKPDSIPRALTPEGRLFDLRSGPFVVQSQQSRQNLLFCQVGGPAISCKYGLIQSAMHIRQPLGTLIVEVGKRALLQLLRLNLRRVQPRIP